MKVVMQPIIESPKSSLEILVEAPVLDTREMNAFLDYYVGRGGNKKLRRFGCKYIKQINYLKLLPAGRLTFTLFHICAPQQKTDFFIAIYIFIFFFSLNMQY